MAETWTIRKILEWTTKDLESRGVSTARLDAEVLLAHALGASRVALYVDLDRPLSAEERAGYRQLLERRRRREPVAHITGEKEFWSLPLAVGPAVLVPRPETEVLVEEALALLAELGPRPLVVDVGTGSGCVAVAIATERPDARVLALDLDRGAAGVAASNACRLGLADRVVVARSDLLGSVGGGASLVVSNPPYIPRAAIDGLAPEVSRWEPRLALDGGEDGLEVIRRLLAEAGSALVPGGALALEVGDDDQARAVMGLVAPPLGAPRLRRDYAGVTRVVTARRLPAEVASAAGGR